MNMKLLDNNRTIYFMLIPGFIAGVILILLTQNNYGGGDHFTHYYIAHWGWKHPGVLLSHWGKPVFSILISPFAQFGINGARIYNLMMGFSTALIVWKLTLHLNLKNSALSILMVLFTPIYFILMFTSLTEVTFSFFLLLSIFLFFKQKYLVSAIVFSFLPLIRTESIVLFPLFVMAYSLKKQFLSLPLLTLGFWLFSMLGYAHYHDFWWLITKLPYTGHAKDVYGSGSLFHFVSSTRINRSILGYPLGILFVIGLIISVVQWWKNDRFKISETFYFLLLIPVSYIVFLSAHSVAWWLGMGNSVGLYRVMGSVTPLAALTALVGYNLITEFINKKNKLIGKISAFSIILSISFLGIYSYQHGFKPTKQQKLIKLATAFLIENNLDEQGLYYFDPYVAFELGIDPYGKTRCKRLGLNARRSSIEIPDGSIIIWDAHYGPNDARVKLNDLQKRSSLKTIKVFKPEKPFKVWGGYDYEVHIFMKVENQLKSLQQI